MPHPLPAAALQAVLAWGTPRLRDLPWRRTRDPWAVLVSEVMLQQTQVARVVPRFEAFIARFPSPVACADAPVGAVVAAWHGLGHNQRAVRLHAAACIVMHEFGGSMPASVDELRRLPGVGPYTSRAVVAFAHGGDAGVVDTNVARVLARSSGRSLMRREVQAMADASVPPGQGWLWNQVALDLGATTCTARRPRCERCPLRPSCAWAGDTTRPDPAAGSAGVSGRQSTFAGSDREGRGRLVAALREGPVRVGDLAGVMGWPLDGTRAERVAATVVADGLAVRHVDVLRLP